MFFLRLSRFSPLRFIPQASCFVYDALVALSTRAGGVLLQRFSALRFTRYASPLLHATRVEFSTIRQLPFLRHASRPFYERERRGWSVAMSSSVS